MGEHPPQQPQDLDEPVLASNLLPPEAGSAQALVPDEKPDQGDEHDFESDLKAVVLQDLGRTPGKESRRAPAPEPSAPLLPPRGERSADVIVLARRVRRWREFTVAMSAIAALLALYVGVSQFAPGLIPMSRQAQPTVAAQLAAPSPSRFVAVLQQDPTTPAFLVSIDPASRMLTVRRVSAAPEPGRSYELWLISNKYPAPRSLGVVGASEFTARPLPSGFDADTHQDGELRHLARACGRLDDRRTDWSDPVQRAGGGVAAWIHRLITENFGPRRRGPFNFHASNRIPKWQARVTARSGYRMVGTWPLIVVGSPALTSGAVPRSRPLPTLAKMPTTATTVAQTMPITTIFKCVARSALYIEWFIATSRFCSLVAAVG